MREIAFFVCVAALACIGIILLSNPSETAPANPPVQANVGTSTQSSGTLGTRVSPKTKGCLDCELDIAR